MSALGAVTEVEIRSEPAVWLATSGRLAESAAAMAQTVAAASSVVFLGCGSSHFGGRLAAELLRRANIPAAAYVSSDYVLRPPVEHGSRPVAVALSRSGETSETLQAISSFRRRHGGHVYGLVCRPGSEIARAVDVAVAIPEADERAVPQTRSVSAFLLFSMLLGATLGGRDILADIARVASEVKDRQASIWSSARIAATASRYVLLGSGSGFALAQEGALKFTEMGRAPAWAYRALEYRHGPIEALDAETTVVGLLGDDPDEAECDAFTEASARAGSVVDTDVIGPHLTGPSSLLGQLYVLQTLALEVARFRALDADQPPNIRAFVSDVWLDPT
jgi:glucosamine--fructose-6-phosphate aminotransferase (isomerizing)